MSDPQYGTDQEYDQNILNLYSGNNKSETIEKLNLEINSLQKLLDENGIEMDKFCIAGYSWSQTMKNNIQYYKDMLKDIDKYYD